MCSAEKGQQETAAHKENQKHCESRKIEYKGLKIHKNRLFPHLKVYLHSVDGALKHGAVYRSQVLLISPWVFRVSVVWMYEAADESKNTCVKMI